MRIAIDTGGTFTDCVSVSEGQLRVLKVPSTPSDPAHAVLDGIAKIGPGEPAEIRHGTTVGTNAVLERKGARVAFVTTAGFEDTIAIGRQARPKLYDLFFTKEPPLAPDGMRFGVAERVASDGHVLLSPTSEELARVLREVAAAKPEAIAVSLLFSFASPSNEQAVVEELRKIGVPISASHEILPEFREYERASTVVMNAYLAPTMQRYLHTLDSELQSHGSKLHVMQSSGGIISANAAAREPVRTILSGPAGGVVGAVAIAKAAGFERILTFDMGGTSTDVALVNCATGLRTSTEFQITGIPIAVPMLDIHTVGAGGGSLAAFDRGGALKVGPDSAGAEPGPICYGRGEQPAVTDANLLLGRLDADCFLGGGMKLDETRTREFAERARGRVPTVDAFAEGIIKVADVHIERALRTISVERGHDPRDFTLVAFGGAGPLHACGLARALRIPKVVVPNMPGALSAYGILVSDVIRDYSRTLMVKPEDAAIRTNFTALEEQGRRDMATEGLTAIATRSLDLRYAGQGYELAVPWSEDFVGDFHRVHEKTYGYSDERRPVEVVNARVRMIAATQPAEFTQRELKSGDGGQAIVKGKPIYFGGEWLMGTIYNRDALEPGDRFSGPAVVVEYSATTFLPPDSFASVDAYSNLVIEVPQ